MIQINDDNVGASVQFYNNIIKGKNSLRIIANNIEELKIKVRKCKENGDLKKNDSILIILTEYNKKIFVEDINDIYNVINKLKEMEHSKSERIRQKNLERMKQDEKIFSLIEKEEDKYYILDANYSEDSSTILLYTTFGNEPLILKCNVEMERRIIRVLSNQRKNFYNFQKKSHNLNRNIKLVFIDLGIISATILSYSYIDLPTNVIPIIGAITTTINYAILEQSKKNFIPKQNPFNSFCDMVEERREKEHEKEYGKNKIINTEVQRLGPPNIYEYINPKQKIIQ